MTQLTTGYLQCIHIVSHGAWIMHLVYYVGRKMYEQEMGIRFPAKVEIFFSSSLTDSGVLSGG